MCTWIIHIHVLSSKNKLANENRSVSDLLEMAMIHDIVNQDLLEDRLVQMWPDYPCLYDVRDASVQSRNVQQLTKEERL